MAATASQPRSGAAEVARGRVVVGFDGSTEARAALKWAVAEARIRRAPLEVWVVLEPPPVEPDEIPEAERAVVADLRTAALGLSAGVESTFHVGRGGAAAQLSATCAEKDLLVVGSRGRGAFAGLFLGSVSRACVQHAPCTVVIVRPRPNLAGLRGKVVVGIDESENALRALHVGAEEARLRGAALEVIHAVHWDHLGAELVVPTTRQLAEWGRTLVHSQLEGAGITARSRVLNGNPADVLVRHSRGADLLVLGSRGHNPLATLTLGSTSDYCARHAACPVMVVRPVAGGGPIPATGDGG